MKWGRISLIIFGAVLVTALGIDAADTMNGSDGTLLSQVISRENSACPPHMKAVDTVSSLTCVDIYEASPGSECPSQNPSHTRATQENMSSKECIAESKESATPWRFITRDMAMQMCARSGKRLPTSEEWYALSLGLASPETSCNVSSKSIGETGQYTECTTANGVYDLVGNVWEWVSDDVIDGVYNMRALPGSGYVTQVDNGGMATVVSETPDELFEKDYFWSSTEGAFGIIRGGYYDSGSDAGVYIVHADTPPTSASPGIGFRCVR